PRRFRRTRRAGRLARGGAESLGASGRRSWRTHQRCEERRGAASSAGIGADRYAPKSRSMYGRLPMNEEMTGETATEGFRSPSTLANLLDRLRGLIARVDPWT